MATKQDLSIFRGGSYIIDVALTDEDNEPLDMTGLTAHYRIAKRVGQEAVIADDEIDVEDSVAQVPLSSAETGGLDPGTYYHELYVEDEAGERFVVMTGQLTLVASQAALAE